MSKRKTRGKASDDKRLNARIGKAIVAAVAASPYSLPTVAAKIGISAQQLHKYLNGTDRIRAATLKKIADLIGVPVGSLYPT